MRYICFSICIWTILPFIIPALETLNVAVYYESLCPDSDDFFRSQLAPTYEKLSNYLNLDLVPYGNARSSGNPGEYTFQCQHGFYECYGNMIQACYINLVNNTADQIKFINCAFQIRKQQKVLEACLDNLDVRDQVQKCLTGSLGNNLLYQNGKKTDGLVPRHTFIPWITINGRGSSNINDKAVSNLKNFLCDEYGNDKPDVCNKANQNLLKQFRSNLL